jgi:hypothetical protein
MTRTKTWVLLTVALAACDGGDGGTGGVLHPGPCVQENDDNADGRIDTRIVYTYDESGLLILRETDAEPEFGDLDGVPEGASHYHYEGELLVLKEVDYGADGTVDQRYDFYYDENEYLVLVLVSSWPDETLEADYEFLNDERGNVLEAMFTYYIGDCTWRDIELYTYDADDNLVAEEFIDDALEDDAIDEHHFHLIDENGLRYRTDRDLDGDYVTDAETFYVYDSNGLLIIEETDNGPDQAIDRVETYEYDDGGNLTFYVLDQHADGWEDATQAFSYDCW